MFYIIILPLPPPLADSPNVVQDVSVLAFNMTAVTVGFTPPANTDLRAMTDGYIIYYTNRSENVTLDDWRVLRKVSKNVMESSLYLIRKCC